MNRCSSQGVVNNLHAAKYGCWHVAVEAGAAAYVLLCLPRLPRRVRSGVLGHGFIRVTVLKARCRAQQAFMFYRLLLRV